jgi:hypothetical protein
MLFIIGVTGLAKNSRVAKTLLSRNNNLHRAAWPRLLQIHPSRAALAAKMHSHDTQNARLVHVGVQI